MDKKNISVLIAEDDFLVGKEITRALNQIGYDISGIAPNGEKAVTMNNDLNPDVILMDINMPKMDGLQASQKIQEVNPTPIVILTAHESQDFVEEASEAGVGAYLTKPPNASQIEKAITVAIARHNDLMKLKRLNAELEKQKNELQKALDEIETLRGMVPICSKCKKIRDDEGFWQQVEVYFEKYSDVEFSHGVCPDCLRDLYGEDMYQKVYGKK